MDPFHDIILACLFRHLYVFDAVNLGGKKNKKKNVRLKINET